MDALLIVGSAPRYCSAPANSGDERRWSLTALRLGLIASVFVSAGATFSTPNFTVNAPTPEFARQVGEYAELYRDEIAVAWLGQKLPRWYKPCPIEVKVGQIGAGGATSFCFDRGEVFGWKMTIQGSEERILDSVLPHEVSHTIFACHFRRPLPRWADEGAATLVEHESERNRQVLLLNQVIQTSKRIPLRQLLSMKEYPREMQQVLTLYAEGYSLASFLVQQGGRTRFLKFLDDAHKSNSWDEALARHYEIRDVGSLEKTWTQWIIAGSPALPRRDVQLAEADRKAKAANDAVVRSQSPENEAPAFIEESEFVSRGAAASRNPSALPAAPAGNSRSRLRKDGWSVQPPPQRLPRPNPLGERSARPASPIGESPNDSEQPAFDTGPPLSARGNETSLYTPKFENDDDVEFEAGVASRHDDAQPIPDPRVTSLGNRPDFDASPGSSETARNDWAAFPGMASMR